MENIQILKTKLNKMNISLSEEKLDKLESYVELLSKWNSAYNLVGKSTLESIYTRHILDSLQLIPYLRGGQSVLDFGAGAGIPSVVLAIVLDNVQFTACERIGKKCQFLNQARRELNLQNFTVIQDDVRSINEDFDVITCRAVATIEEIMNLTSEIRHLEQVYVLLKGRMYQDEIKQLESLDISFEYEVAPSVVEEDSVVLKMIVK